VVIALAMAALAAVEQGQQGTQIVSSDFIGVHSMPRNYPGYADSNAAVDQYMRSRMGYGPPVYQPQPGERSIHSGNAPIKGSPASNGNAIW
jgi:hypothetical protein